MAVGLLTMLFGAFLVIAPGAGAAHWTSTDVNPDEEANPSCADIGYDVEAKDNVERNAPYSGSVEGGDGLDPEGFLRVDYTLNADGTVDFVVDQVDTEDDPASDYAVAAVIIKKGSTQSGAGARVYEYDPATLADEGLQTIPEGATSFSHITFCGGELPDDPCDDIGDVGEDCDPCDDIGDVGEDCDPCDDIGDVGEDCDPCDDIGDVGEDCDPCDDIGDVGEDCDPCDDIGDVGEDCEEPEVECDATEEWTDVNEDGIVQAEECTEVIDEVEEPEVCPEGTTHTDANGDGEVQSTECVEVKDSTTPKPVVQPVQTAKTPAVLGAQTARALATTGSGSDSLVTVGVALLLFGAVLTLGSRRRVRYLR